MGIFLNSHPQAISWVMVPWFAPLHGLSEVNVLRPIIDKVMEVSEVASGREAC